MSSNNPDAWNPEKFFKLFQSTLEAYEKEHPHWRIEVLVSLIGRGLLGLKQHIEDPNKTGITWDNPFVELHYPVDWDWNAPRDGDIVSNKLVSGKITQQNTADAETTRKTIGEIMVRHLNTLALQDFTNHVWLEKHEGRSNLIPILPAKFCEELNAIKNQRERQEALNQLARPFSIGAALIDYGDKELKDGARVPKRVLKQLANIDKLIDIPPIRFSGSVSGRKVEMSLVFQIHPLTIDYERKKAYHSITVGLFIMPEIVGDEIVTTTPASWPKNDQETLWRELFQEVVKLTDLRIPKAESQTSEILSINAQIEIPLASSHPEERNAAQKKVLEALSQTGRVREISMKSVENNLPGKKELQPKEQPIPETFEDVLRKPILKSRFRLPIAIVVVLVGGLIAVYAILPDEVKLRIWNHLVNLFHNSRGN
jgi:hypothetical protein